VTAAVVFDCDGTLVDSEPLARRAWTELLDARGYALTDADYAAVLGRPYPRVHAYFAERAELEPHPEFWEHFSTTLFALIGSELRPFADALDAVAGLRAAGVPVAVASSSPRARLDLTLARAGLDGAFAVTVAGDEVEHGKPAPDMYLAAASALGADPADCVAVEDTAPGIASALAAGMTAVGIGRTASERATLAAADVRLERLSAAALLAAQPSSTSKETSSA
jgi:HAD superfamily hydrolase (TIGR01509 family)